MSLRNGHSSDNISSDIKDKDRGEAHRAILESTSLDRVWKFALDELGRMKINFDPAYVR
jgi:hypothetical protein